VSYRSYGEFVRNGKTTNDPALRASPRSKAISIRHTAASTWIIPTCCAPGGSSPN